MMLILPVCLSSAQWGKYSLTVKAIDRFGSPIPGALILLYSSDWEMIDQKVADSDGQVVFTLSPGKYHLELRIYHDLAEGKIGICVGAISVNLTSDKTVSLKAPDYPYTLTAQVYYSDGKIPVPGATVRIYFPIDAPDDTQATKVGQTDQNGFITFDKLPKKWWYYEKYDLVKYKAEVCLKGYSYSPPDYSTPEFTLPAEGVTIRIEVKQVSTVPDFQWALSLIATVLSVVAGVIEVTRKLKKARS
jgi:hypothetical protein